MAVGAALTGQDDQTDVPTKDIVTSSTSNLYDKTLGDPASRAALLQIGLNLMQPVAMGQTAGGHIGQAVGSGGEAVGRQEEADIKEKAADNKLELANKALEIRQQQADAATARAANAKGDVISSSLQYQIERDTLNAAQKEKDRRDKIASDAAEAINKKVNSVASDALVPATDPDMVKYKGKTQLQIQDMLRKEYDEKNGPVDTPARPSLKPAIRTGGGGAAPSLPPQNERIPGQTRIRLRGGGTAVWGKDADTGQLGWITE